MAVSYLILCLCLFLVLPSITADTYKCKEPSKELVEKLGNQYSLDIFDVSQILTYDYRDTLIDLPTTNYTALLFGHVKVDFSGHLLPKGENAGNLTKETFDTNTVVVHHKVENTEARCKVNEADFLKTEGTSRLEVIHKLTTSCLEEFVCSEWEKFIARDFFVKQQLEASVNEIFKHYAKSQHVGRIPETTTTTTEASFDGHYDAQGTWNPIFDIATVVAIDQMVGSTKGLLIIPEMKFDLTTMGSAGDVVLKNITIDGLNSLERTKDLILNRYKNRYDLSTGMRVTNLQVKVPYYKGRFGVIPIDGVVSANVSELAVTLEASVDYNVRPCKIKVNELTKDKLEDPKVKFTGLSVLNWPIRKFAEHFIRNNLFDMAQEVLVSQISELNCERFRTAVESMK